MRGINCMDRQNHFLVAKELKPGRHRFKVRREKFKTDLRGRFFTQMDNCTGRCFLDNTSLDYLNDLPEHGVDADIIPMF